MLDNQRYKGFVMSYVSTVVDFLNTRTTPEVSLTPEDYTAIAEWEKQEIPLGFVLSSLDRRLVDLETKLANDADPINEMRSDIVSEFAAWLQERDRANDQ